MSRKRYRGRRGGTGLLRVLPVSLAVVFVLGLSAYFVLRDFIVIDERGLSLDIPILMGTPTPTPPDVSPEINIEVVETTPPPLSGSEETRAPELIKLNALFVPQAAILSEEGAQEYIDMYKNTSINALVLEMKTEAGKLTYNSSVPEALDAGAANASQKAESSIREMRGEGIYLAAYLSCFKDNTVPRKNQDLAVMHRQDVTWLDEKSISWLSPFSEGARRYIEGLALELCELGFNEIILDRVSFAVTGQTEQIDYGENEDEPRTPVISSFLENLRQKLSKKGVVLTCLPEASTLKDGFDADAGQDLAMITENSDRIMARIPQKNLAEEFALIKSGVADIMGQEELALRFVPMVTAPQNPAGKTSSEKMATDIGLCGADLSLGFVAYSPAGRYPADAFGAPKAGLSGEAATGEERE